MGSRKLPLLHAIQATGSSAPQILHAHVRRLDGGPITSQERRQAATKASKSADAVDCKALPRKDVLKGDEEMTRTQAIQISLTIGVVLGFVFGWILALVSEPIRHGFIQ